MDSKYLATAYWTSGKTGSALVTPGGNMTFAVESVKCSLCVLPSVGWNLEVTYIVCFVEHIQALNPNSQVVKGKIAAFLSECTLHSDLLQQCLL